MSKKAAYSRPEINKLGTFADLTRARDIQGKNDGISSGTGTNKTVN
jgi:hypothetical protein